MRTKLRQKSSLKNRLELNLSTKLIIAAASLSIVAGIILCIVWFTNDSRQTIASTNKAIALKSIYKNGVIVTGAKPSVELISFTANSSSNHIDLNWITASEANNNYFSVERSSDGKNFTSIGIKKSAGNSESIIDYKFPDTEPYSGINYYRLKQVYIDDTYAYSGIIAVVNKL